MFLLVLTAMAPCDVGAVCKKVVQDIFDSVPKEDRKSRDAIETAIAQHCKKGKDGAFRKGLSSKEKKACYYIYDIKRKVSDPLARGVPADRVCKKLKKANSELCEMRFRTSLLQLLLA